MGGQIQGCWGPGQAGSPLGRWTEQLQSHPRAFAHASLPAQNTPFFALLFILFTSSRKPSLTSLTSLWLGPPLPSLGAGTLHRHTTSLGPSRQAFAFSPVSRRGKPPHPLLGSLPHLPRKRLHELFSARCPHASHHPAPLTAEDLASFSTEDGETARRELLQMPPPGPHPHPSICLPVTTDTPPGSPSAHSRRGSSPSPLPHQPPISPSLPAPFSAHRHAGRLPTW